ncbi:MAG: YdcF family protein [Bdellovibrionaceae bacterium]|nr:YdcF family protein [Pseudobdellovibrionaceae bacterium]
MRLLFFSAFVAGFTSAKKSWWPVSPFPLGAKITVPIAGIVLTGGPGRVREGFDLLAQGQVHKLIISGVHPRATLRDIFPQWPYYGTLRASDVVLERRSGTTYGNAQQSLPLVEALRCRSLVLVTSHLHMRRAFKTFRQVYPPELLILTRAVSSGSIPPRSSDLSFEVLKSLFYSLWAY